jgi:hypothetical protein
VKKDIMSVKRQHNELILLGLLGELFSETKKLVYSTLRPQTPAINNDQPLVKQQLSMYYSSSVRLATIYRVSPQKTSIHCLIPCNIKTIKNFAHRLALCLKYCHDNTVISKLIFNYVYTFLYKTAKMQVMTILKSIPYDLFENV